jgi:hypothetical protein
MQIRRIFIYEEAGARVADLAKRESQREAVFRFMIPLLTALPSTLSTAWISAAAVPPF